MAIAFAMAFEPAWAARSIMTPSGQPDVVFPNAKPRDAAGKVTNACFDRGWQVVLQNPAQVVCEVPVGAPTSALQQLTIGGGHASRPRTFVKINFVQAGEHTRAQAIGWTETPTARGQGRLAPYGGDKAMDSLQSFLLDAGGEPVPGTRFAGVYLGVDLTPEMAGKQVVLKVSMVVPSTAAAEAGILAGDKLQEVNGQTFKDVQDFQKKLDKIGPGVRFPVKLDRNGVSQTVMVTGRTLPVVGSPEWVALEDNRRAVELAKSAAPAVAAAASAAAAMAASQ